ncbi:MAG: hypothetical protein ACFCUN_08380 [Hyphomicrobiaceae bacterium]
MKITICELIVGVDLDEWWDPAGGTLRLRVARGMETAAWPQRPFDLGAT